MDKNPSPPLWAPMARAKMRQLGLKQHDLIEPLGVKSRGAVGHYFRGRRKTSIDQLKALAKILDLQLEVLISAGDSSSLAFNIEEISNEYTTANLDRAPKTEGYMPLISSITAGKLCEAIDMYEPGDAEDWLPRHSNHSKHTFALRVKGDSMTSQHPGQRSYPEGVIIYVDPDKLVTNGARVVAKVPGDNEATFKLYVEDMGKKFLKPINSSYHDLDVTGLDFHICGVVVGAYMPE